MKLMLMAGGSKLMLILKLMLVKLKLVLGGWAAVLPRVQLGASLPSLPSIPSLLEPGQDMGSSRQGGEASRAPGHTSLPACSATHLLKLYTVLLRTPPRTYSTSSPRSLCVASFKQDSGLKIKNSPPLDIPTDLNSAAHDEAHITTTSDC